MAEDRGVRSLGKSKETASASEMSSNDYDAAIGRLRARLGAVRSEKRVNNGTVLIASASGRNIETFPSRIDKIRGPVRLAKKSDLNNLCVPAENNSTSSALSPTTCDRSNMGDGIGLSNTIPNEDPLASGPLPSTSIATAGSSDAASSAAVSLSDVDMIKDSAVTAELSAALRVFFTTELLEEVLIQVSSSSIDILRARQVAHKFNAVIAKNEDLRRIIFLERQHVHAYGQPAGRISFRIGSRPRPMPPELTLVQRNPFVFGRIDIRLPSGALTLRPKFEEYALGTYGDSFPMMDDMFVTNPPIEMLRLNLGSRRTVRRCGFNRQLHNTMLGDCGHSVTDREVRKEGGIKVRDLVAAIVKLCSHPANRKGKYMLINSVVMMPALHEAVAEDFDGPRRWLNERQIGVRKHRAPVMFMDSDIMYGDDGYKGGRGRQIE
ncbi:unnamed protein product [Zymoseptoria tritici ST99CH_1A5]|uniref:F-box domain-containing protein n=1 Tax=Zymoseptoria tritici ST99CH_1A5 TaxID=1276529 RepID=A0A1Y6LQ02_ZYMTR|nr:unnamed protein product [Zymoseptoria tritici ST99CH_1A5]